MTDLTTTCPNCEEEVSYNSKEANNSFVVWVKCPYCNFEIDIDFYEDMES